MMWCATSGRTDEFGEKFCALPADDGTTDDGGAPSSRLGVMIEIPAGQTRGRAEAREGVSLE